MNNICILYYIISEIKYRVKNFYWRWSHFGGFRYIFNTSQVNLKSHVVILWETNDAPKKRSKYTPASPAQRETLPDGGTGQRCVNTVGVLATLQIHPTCREGKQQAPCATWQWGSQLILQTDHRCTPRHIEITLHNWYWDFLLWERTIEETRNKHAGIFLSTSLSFQKPKHPQIFNASTRHLLRDLHLTYLSDSYRRTRSELSGWTQTSCCAKSGKPSQECRRPIGILRCQKGP